MRARRLTTTIGIALPILIVGLVAWVRGSSISTAAARSAAAGAIDTRMSATSRADLDRTVKTMTARLTARPTDSTAAIALADALLRQTRVNGNAGLAMHAEFALKTVLDHDRDDYDARRMLAAVYLSQHRFRDAIGEAERCRAMRASDAWVYGVLGDAHIELGDYPEAFDAFDRMTALRPNAAAYARASYARELQGDLDGALRLMQMATDATSAQDAESLAWHHAQLGHLYLELGSLDAARREYEHTDFVFPGHPFALDGLARVEAARGHDTAALELVMKRLDSSPTPADAAFAGDLLAKLGRPDAAELQYRLAEAAWRVDAPEPSKLARFLAGHRRHLDEAVRLAEGAGRHDIFTDDALAWAYFQTGRVAEARAAIRRALRTGSCDKDIRAHAAAIEGRSE